MCLFFLELFRKERTPDWRLNVKRRKILKRIKNLIIQQSSKSLAIWTYISVAAHCLLVSVLSFYRIIWKTWNYFIIAFLVESCITTSLSKNSWTKGLRIMETNMHTYDIYNYMCTHEYSFLIISSAFHFILLRCIICVPVLFLCISYNCLLWSVFRFCILLLACAMESFLLACRMKLSGWMRGRVKEDTPIKVVYQWHICCQWLSVADSVQITYYPFAAPNGFPLIANCKKL